jgi:hypothetical protein
VSEADTALDRFVALSAGLTGFSEGEIWGTGVARRHYDELLAIVDADLVARLLDAGWQARGEPAALVARVMSNPDLGPVARNLIKAWYLGQWDEMPRDWRDRNGANPLDANHMVSAAAYREGLVWPTIGSHPMGAKPPGFGSWGTPPGGAA